MIHKYLYRSMYDFMWYKNIQVGFENLKLKIAQKLFDMHSSSR